MRVRFVSNWIGMALWRASFNCHWESITYIHDTFVNLIYLVTSGFSHFMYLHYNTPLSFKLNYCPDKSCAETFTAMTMCVNDMSVDDNGHCCWWRWSLLLMAAAQTVAETALLCMAMSMSELPRNARRECLVATIDDYIYLGDLTHSVVTVFFIIYFDIHVVLPLSSLFR